MRNTGYMPHAFATAVVVLILLASTIGATAQQGAEPPRVPGDAAYTPRGADTCLKCHADPKVMTIFKTPHAQRADSRTPFAGLQCETCHGPGNQHAGRVRFGEQRPPILRFGARSPSGIPEQNAVCLGCHTNAGRTAWPGSVHQREGLACVNCHTIHATRDPVILTREQPPVCEKCHMRTRMEFNAAHTHPVRFGEMSCTDCHQPHGSFTPALLVRDTVNQTCDSCHADKRGPFLWEHPPVAEDCMLCHRPHGSNNPALLAQRPPLLCQQCHAPNDHPSIPQTALGLPQNMPSIFLLGSSCVNCHSQVHGSNSPSGADLTR